MAKGALIQPPLLKSLSARLLVLTIFFVMLSEVLIYVPSIARFRLVFLEARLAAAELASQTLRAAPDQMVGERLRNDLLRQAGAIVIMLKSDQAKALMLSVDSPPEVAARFDLDDQTPMTLIRDAFVALAVKPRIIQVSGASRHEPGAAIEILMDESAMQMAMYDYSGRILNLSIVISLITAGLVYLSLQLLMVRPMRRITESMMRFRAAPEDASEELPATGRSDEIGMAQRELTRMQSDLRNALTQKTRLAALGTAVSKINHDLRNILATAQIVSDRLIDSDDPDVRRITPMLMKSIDRAIGLCMQTLSYGRAEDPKPHFEPFALAPLIDDVRASLEVEKGPSCQWQVMVPPDLLLIADREQMFRVLANLARNAVEVLTQGGELTIRAERVGGGVDIEIEDNGPGLGERARAHLFEAFAGGARAGGTGLGLAIARDIMRAHGGDIELVESGPMGTTFRLHLPDH